MIRTEELPVEQVTAPGRLAESPLWDSHRNRLWWVDIPARALHCLDPVTGLDEVRLMAADTAAVALIEGREDLLVAMGPEVGVLSWATGEWQRICTLDSGVRTNDGAVDPAGRYVVGTMCDESEPGTAELYSVSETGVRTLASGATISNGVDWSLDGTTMYYVDTPLERVDAFDYDVATGELSHRRVLVDLADVPGRPDGLTVDAAGGIWVAMARGGGAVRRFTPDGVPDRVIAMPVPHITSMTFGGPELNELYITTSTMRMSPQDLARWPAAGAVFRVADPGVTGRRPYEYRVPSRAEPEGSETP